MAGWSDFALKQLIRVSEYRAVRQSGVILADILFFPRVDSEALGA